MARRRRFRSVLTACTGALLLGAVLPGAAQAQPTDTTRAPNGSNGSQAARAPERVRELVQEMTLEEKVGQLFVPFVYGENADTQDPADVHRNQELYGVDNAKQLIEKYDVGGVIYYTWSDNLKSPRQVATLSNGLQRAAMGQGTSVPLLIGTDQEQGAVFRMPGTRFPGNMALGAGRSTADARKAAKITARELRAVGINQNYAPVADVNVNPANPVIGVRSFGSDPQLVAKMTAAQVEGHQSRGRWGVAATAKHFPGHGDTDVDSHTGLPVIDHTREEWERIDLPPFQAAIDHDVAAIMTAHILVPALDPSGDPATLSKPIMTGILREELGYEGVVISDSLGMAAVREKYGDARVPVLAIKAGVDLMLKPPKFELQYNAVIEAVKNGEISKQRLNEAVTNVLTLKRQLKLFRDPYVDPGKAAEVVGSAQHRKAAQRISDRTVTLVKNQQKLLPLDASGDRDILVTGSSTDSLAESLGERAAGVDAYNTGTSPSQSAIDEAVRRAKSHDLAVVTVGQIAEDEGQQQLVKSLAASGTPVAVVATDVPYAIRYFPEVDTYLAAYSGTDVSMESVARVLFGEVSPQGKLPVMIPKAGQPDEALYPFGHGLTYQ